MALRAELQRICTQLLDESAVDGRVALDAIGDALGARRVDMAEIEAIVAALEDAGRQIVGPRGGDGESQLAQVLASARALRSSGAAPTIAAIVQQTGLTPEQVRHALALAQIMQR